MTVKEFKDWVAKIDPKNDAYELSYVDVTSEDPELISLNLTHHKPSGNITVSIGG